MATARFILARAGPLVSVQDGGRPGLMRFGVPASGPMDRGAFAIANAALGNPSGLPAIEISMGGLALDCVEGCVTIAVAGGDFRVAIDGVALGAWVAATIRAGSRLVVSPGARGSWSCLAFAGRLRAGSWLGSVSTHGPSGRGGGMLAAGQALVLENAELRDERLGEIARPDWSGPREAVKVVLGPQDRFFAPGTIEALLSRPFTLTDAYDRMGVRLSGPSLRPDAALDMPSEPIVRGSIQASGDGVATVLLADHQTTGGYPKIATIVSGDLDGFAQLRGRDVVRFSAITPAAAIEAARRHHHAREQVLAGLRGGGRSLTQRLWSANLIDGVVSGSAL